MCTFGADCEFHSLHVITYFYIKTYGWTSAIIRYSDGGSFSNGLLENIMIVLSSTDIVAADIVCDIPIGPGYGVYWIRNVL